VISPASGGVAGGTTIKITGANFTGVSAVKFGSTSASAFTVESTTEITATAPARKPGTVDVNVVTSHGTSSPTSGDRFTFVPESLGYGRCKNVGAGSGKFKTVACTEPLEGGKSEWYASIVKSGITFVNGTETVEKVVKPHKVVLETTGKVQLLCTNLSGSGTYFNTAVVSGATLTLTGCEWKGSKCASAGASEGEIRTRSLTGALGWREKAGNLVGLALAPEAEEGPVLEATCGTASLKVTGSVIGAITPINNMTGAFTLKFKESKGVQAIGKFESEGGTQSLRLSINGGISAEIGLSLEAAQTGEEELEINTVV
jgi:hypothetical protein